MSHETTKGARYVQLLDQARCSGDWNAVPELVRKVKKHNHQRNCLVLVAESEYAVAQASKGRPTTGRNMEPSGLSRLITPLREAIEKEHTYIEDAFQAQVCLAWVHWVLGEFTASISNLPARIEQHFAQFDGAGRDPSEWTKVCALKALYIKGSSLAKTDAPAKAIETFELAMPILSRTTSSSSDSSELRTWTELLLTQYCMLSVQSQGQTSSVSDTNAILAFREWSAFWNRQSSNSATLPGGYATQVNVPRREVWKQYYIMLTTTLQRNVSYSPTSNTTLPSINSSRIHLRLELQQVEKKYEALLLREVSFPRAEQASEEVEEWVDLVMGNWRTLCGVNWEEDELPTGGKEGVSRNVLAILYRAATKTFHSTPILRHLFTVHLAVAEFELAFKAFDTYLDIVNKGKARIEKTGEVEQGFDNDEIVIQTVSECIQALCRFGSTREAEKARSLAKYVQDWVGKQSPKVVSKHIVNGNGSSGFVESPRSANIPAGSLTVLPLAWRAIGISQAQLARVTLNASSRPDMQLQAVKSFRKALSEDYGSADDVGTLFALAIVLAERRDIGPAIDVVKAALLPPKTLKGNVSGNSRSFLRERSLIPLWHLLALLLSARQEFTTAARACEGAFEQFKDPRNLFGEAELDGTYRHSTEMGSDAEKPGIRNKGVIDEMDDFERESVLEVKMTQLVLIEVIEGPDVAVNASDELLSLFTRLFDEPQSLPPATPKVQAAPPRSSAGTLRSLKGSMFGRSPRSVRTETEKASSIANERTSNVSRPQTSQAPGIKVTAAPKIHITHESDGAHHSVHAGHHEKLQKRSSSLTGKPSKGGIHDRDRSRSASRPRTGNRASETEGDRPTNVESEKMSGPVTSTPSRLGTATSNSGGQLSSPDSSSVEYSSPRLGTQQAANFAQDRQHKLAVAKPAGSPTHQGSDVLSTPGTTPVTRFPKNQARRHRIQILIKVWLLIAGFYRRAEMYEDAKGAIDEAYKLVENLELEISNDLTGNVSIADPSWGVSKSVEQLWGDVWSERGYLSLARSSPYTALSDFENALVHFADHPTAIVGLSNILLDIYTEILPPLPSIPALVLPDATFTPTPSALTTPNPATPSSSTPPSSSASSIMQPGPLGLPPPKPATPLAFHTPRAQTAVLKPEHLASSTALLGRLAARDRAYGLLSSLTKLGSGWNYSEAWYALARAYEEGGQVDKAKEVLWWCVELEEGRGVRDWHCVGVGGYVL